jgi:ketosteroid isomerase-like protein
MTQAQSSVAARNKQLMQAVFAELANGNRAPMRELYADDVTFTLIGTTRWSKTYRGKQAVIDELFKPLFAQFADQYTASATRFIADDDVVAVEFRGKVTTNAGKPYHNTYCTIYRLADGKICEMTEYCDTALVAAVL